MATVGEVPQDRLDRFYRYSQSEVTDLYNEIQNLSQKSSISGEQSHAIDHCAARISTFAESIRDAASYLPAHDQKSYSEAIKALTEALSATRSDLSGPRQKFSFKKKNASAVSISDAAQLASQRNLKAPGYHEFSSTEVSSFVSSPAEAPSPAPEMVDTNEEPTPSVADPQTGVRKPLLNHTSMIRITNHRNQHMILPASAGHATSQGQVSNLTGCVIDLSTPTMDGKPVAGLTLRDVKDSLVVCGHVDGPAHITGVRNSTIVVACRQFRMHESHDTDVYLLCGSRPIIEDCTGVRFAPLPGCYVCFPRTRLTTILADYLQR